VYRPGDIAWPGSTLDRGDLGRPVLPGSEGGAELLRESELGRWSRGGQRPRVMSRRAPRPVRRRRGRVSLPMPGTGLPAAPTGWSLRSARPGASPDMLASIGGMPLGRSGRCASSSGCSWVSA